MALPERVQRDLLSALAVVAGPDTRVTGPAAAAAAAAGTAPPVASVIEWHTTVRDGNVISCGPAFVEATYAAMRCQ